MATTARPLLTQHQRDALRSLTELVIAAVEFLGTGGLITVDDLIPGVRRLLRAERHSRDWRRVTRAIDRAANRKLISIESDSDKPHRIKLTERGRALLSQRLLEGCAVERPHRWDGRWRVLVFDVPEKKRRERDVLRAMLRRLGFRYLQRSVWVYPFDCAEVVDLLRAANQLSHITVRSITAVAIEEDRSLRSHFGLRERP